ncbi:unnamed protein product [Mytilus edulis]|uniref:Uncharacterized protein n=1 Tax=Mytilus edulis TaxID=6550 RepID=A0A8S3SVP5_MYTED|nr:unnamed protein product [Mytilus edulis]
MMITNAPIVANQAQPVQTDVRMSRIRALRILGGAQIGLGVICVIISIVGVILSNTEKNSNCYNYYYSDYVTDSSYYRCRTSTGDIVLLYLITMVCSGWQQSVIYIHTVQPGLMHNMPNTQIPTRNQHEYDQLWKPEMAGYNGQQPAYITNNQQQPGHLLGNQLLIRDYHGEQPQPFTMANQKQNINTQQLVYSPETAAYTTIQVVNNNI